MAIRVSDSAKSIVCRALNVNDFKQIVDRDFQSLDSDHDVDRTKVGRYADRNRGSIRLNAGKFYTAHEFEERVRRVKKLKLPG